MLTNRFVKVLAIGLTTLVFAGCATHHDRKANNTMMGAGVGAAAGAVLSKGDPLYTLGGAAAGGVLGNILTDDDRRKSRGWDNNRGSRHDVRHRDNRRHDNRRGRSRR